MGTPPAPLKATTQISLRIESGRDEGRVVPVRALPFVCGRKLTSNLILHDSDVSWTHCMITEGADGGLYLIDLQSTNGTFLDGEKLAKGRVPLHADALISLGGVIKLRVIEGEAIRRSTSERRSKAGWGKRLTRRMVCPNCWHQFLPEDVFFVAKHPDLMGDPVLGEDEYLRFQPTRFNEQGEALDPKGFATRRLACPRCHLGVPQTLLEVLPLFISQIGSPASGKSYYLTAMAWELRRLMPRAGLTFTDADPHANGPIHEYEQTLFMNEEPDKLTEIRKTQTDDPRLYRTVLIDEASIRFPVPLQFTLWPTADHSHYQKAHKVGRVVVLYDNAGEDYLPGAEENTSAVVDHLARVAILFFLFDPTQDVRFRKACTAAGIELSKGLRKSDGQGLRQETLLKEASVKVRRYRGLAEGSRVRKPLIVIVPKFDVWGPLTDLSLDVEPYVESDGQGLLVDLERIEAVSKQVRTLFQEVCPEFVATADGLSEVVRFVPVTSLGRKPELVARDEHSFYGIRPKDIQPRWVTVPLMYCLCKWAPGLLESTRSLLPQTPIEAESGESESSAFSESDSEHDSEHEHEHEHEHESEPEHAQGETGS